MSHGRLYRYDLATHRTRSWALPRRGIANYPQYERGTMGVASHTRTRLFWLATKTLNCEKVCGDESWTVLAAPAG